MAPLASGGGGVDPLALTMARMVGAAAFFQGVRALGRFGPRVSTRDHLRIAGLSVLGIVLNQTLFIYGLSLTSAVAAAILGATIPVFTAAIAVIWGQEAASP